MLQSSDPAVTSTDLIQSPPRKKGKSVLENNPRISGLSEDEPNTVDASNVSLLTLMSSESNSVHLHVEDDMKASEETKQNSPHQQEGVKSLYQDEDETDNDSNSPSKEIVSNPSGSHESSQETEVEQTKINGCGRIMMRSSRASSSVDSSLYNDTDDEQSLRTPEEEVQETIPDSIPAVASPLTGENISSLVSNGSSGHLTHPLSDDEEDEEDSNLHTSHASLPERKISPTSPVRTNTFGSLPDLQPPRLAGSILRRPSDSDPAPRRLNLEVSFDKVHIRRYFMCMGDNPTCSIGAPVALSWEFEPEDPHDVDTYEYERGPRRRVRHMVLNFYKRQDILRRAGYSDDEIQTAAKELHKFQRQRSKTQIMLPVRKIEEAFESAGRKFKRFGKAKNNPRRTNSSSGRERRRPSMSDESQDLKAPALRRNSISSKNSSQDSKGSKSSQGSSSHSKKSSPTKSFLRRLSAGGSENSDASSITLHKE